MTTYRLLAREVGVPVGHFGASWQPFWIFEVLIEGMLKSKNIFNKSCSGSPITKGVAYRAGKSGESWQPSCQ